MNATPATASAPQISTRRQFLAPSALASGLLILPRGLHGQGKKSPNERLRIALVGVGGRGGAARSGLAEEQFVALCDVDEKRGRAGLTGGKKQLLSPTALRTRGGSRISK